MSACLYVVVIFLFYLGRGTESGSFCYEHSGYGPIFYGYCKDGCCGTNSKRKCCREDGDREMVRYSVNAGIIAGAVIGAIVFFAIFISIIFCIFIKCVKKRQPGRMVAPAGQSIAMVTSSTNLERETMNERCFLANRYNTVFHLPNPPPYYLEQIRGKDRLSSDSSPLSYRDSEDNPRLTRSRLLHSNEHRVSSHSRVLEYLQLQQNANFTDDQSSVHLETPLPTEENTSSPSPYHNLQAMDNSLQTEQGQNSKDQSEDNASSCGRWGLPPSYSISVRPLSNKDKASADQTEELLCTEVQSPQEREDASSNRSAVLAYTEVQVLDDREHTSSSHTESLADIQTHPPIR